MRMRNVNRVFPKGVARTCNSRLTGGRQIVTGLKDDDDAVIKSAPCDSYTLIIAHLMAPMSRQPRT